MVLRISHRDGGIRTRDPLNPIQVRYRTALRPVFPVNKSIPTPPHSSPVTNTTTNLRIYPPTPSNGTARRPPITTWSIVRANHIQYDSVCPRNLATLASPSP